tara:strand:+ start:1819 stop:2097 length:279 start_codon:yes stop_codon:yes gene_type:complete
VQHGTPLTGIKRAGDERRRDRSAECPLGLVLYERNQGAQHECEPRQGQGWDLIAEALATARWKYAERIPAPQRGAHRRLLAVAERQKSELIV